MTETRATDTREIAVELIDVENRIRPADPDWVAALADRITEGAELAPIVVRRRGNRFVLVAGLHRLLATQAAGRPDIRAEVRDLDDHQARLVEIDENLMRRELSALDRALFLAERKRVYDAMRGEARGRKSLADKGKEKSQTLRQFLGARFTRDAALRLGWSERTVQAAINLASDLSPEVVDLLRTSERGRGVVDNAAQLRLLAQQGAADQIRIARALVGGADPAGAGAEEPAASTVKGAMAALGLGDRALVDPMEALFLSFVGLWGRADRRTRARIRKHVAGDGA